MAVKKKFAKSVLGRGLDQIEGGKGLDALIDTTGVKTQGSSTINEVPVSQIEANPNQPRRDFDQQALQELANSIREVGIITPIIRNVAALTLSVRLLITKKVGTPIMPASVKQISCRLVRLNATFSFTLDKSLGTFTLIAIIILPYCAEKILLDKVLVLNKANTNRML